MIRSIPRGTQPRRRGASVALAATALASGVAAAPASATTYVPLLSGDRIGVQDAAAPGLDTGSIRNTTAQALTGFGGLRLRVSGSTLTQKEQTFNGELMRGFGLQYDGFDRFKTTKAVPLGGVSTTRSIRVARDANWFRYLDTFTNTTSHTVTAEVVFGGQTGWNTGANQTRILDTTDGDTDIETSDTWAEMGAAATKAGPSSFGPSAVVIGSANSGFGATSNFLRDSFNQTIATTGHESNFTGYKNTFTLLPGESRSLLRFVVTGISETRALTTGAPIPAAGTQIAQVKNDASTLATTPVVSDLSASEICSVTNWSTAALSGSVNCSLVTPLDPDVARQVMAPTTSSPYDVVGKTIEQMQADMESGKTTSQEITRAYLDRIAAYDTGQFGFHSYIYIADDAMEQAKAADEARAKGRKSAMLGIPVGVKDLYSTKDMPTTGGSRVFDGFRPQKDSFIVKRIREAGGVILGKTNLSEYANSGHFSESAFGQVWNAFEPSKSSIGSSGGSAVSTALSLNSWTLGSQTGDSLWGPSSAASLYSLRGTDGMTSNARVMPLTWLQDYAGPITRSVGDLADSLNVITGTDPEDFRTKDADKYRPADWRSTFKADALQGKKIGYLPSAFADPFGTTATSDALKATFSTFTQAGATVVEMTGTQPTPPTVPAGQSLGDRSWEGWARWLQEHPESEYNNAGEIIMSQKRLPYSRYATPGNYTGAGPMTQSNVDTWLRYRADYKQKIADWMDAQGVDAVVYPGLLSDVNLNDGQIPSFGRLDPPSSASGAPTVIFPAGVNPNGEPMNLQILGKAWEDDKLLGYAYAFDKIKQGHVLPTTAPALEYEPDVTPKPIVIEKPVPGTTVPVTPDPETNNPTPTPTATPAPGTPTPTPGATPTPAPAPAAVTVKITLRFASSATVKSSRVRFTLSNTSAQALTGVVTIKGKIASGGKSSTITLGTGSVKIDAKGKKTLSIALTSKARKALKGRTKITATVTYKLANASGASRVETKKLSIKLR